jgi:hypothetical protein
MITGHTILLLLLFILSLAAFAQCLVLQSPFIAALFFFFTLWLFIELVLDFHYLATRTPKDDHDSH